jgi:hypothetical protein
MLNVMTSDSLTVYTCKMKFLLYYVSKVIKSTTSDIFIVILKGCKNV